MGRWAPARRGPISPAHEDTPPLPSGDESPPQPRQSNIPSILNEKKFDVILLDMNYQDEVSSGSEGFSWLAKILEINPSAVIILMTAYGDIEMAVKGIKEGATEFVLKPWQNEKLLTTISAGVKLSRSNVKIESGRSPRAEILGCNVRGARVSTLVGRERPATVAGRGQRRQRPLLFSCVQRPRLRPC